MTSDDWLKEAEREIARPIACEILATCASTRDEGLLGIAHDIGHEEAGLAAEMALQAWGFCAEKLGYVPGVTDHNMYYEVCAEAEALLQVGWHPGVTDV